MEHLHVSLSAEDFDKAIHGGLDDKPILPEAGDLAFYVKPNGTVGGRAVVAITFSVQLPDGTMARAQATTTAALIENLAAALRGWRLGDHIK